MSEKEAMRETTPHNNAPEQTAQDETRPDMLAAALDCREHGMCIVPVGPLKRPFHNLPGRARLGSGGLLEKVATSERLISKVIRSLTRKPADEAEIRRWHTINPDCNVSVACGSPSGGLLVLDLDSADPEGCVMPRTPRVLTRRGSHVHFKTKHPVRNCDLYWQGEKIGHIIGNGGYAPLPPSTHPDGRHYAWAEGLSPQELGWSYAEPPDWVLDSCKRGESFGRKLNKSMEALRLPLAAIAAYFLLAMIYMPRAFFVGLPVTLFGEMLQMWASSHLTKQSHLTTSGPYAFVRNPMYTGRFFVGFGLILMTWSPWLAGAYALLYAVYAHRRVAGEEERMAELHGDSYDRYRASVRRWIPRLTPNPEAEQSRAQWAKLRRNHEDRVALALLIVTAIMYLRIALHPSPFWPF